MNAPYVLSNGFHTQPDKKYGPGCYGKNKEEYKERRTCTRILLPEALSNPNESVCPENRADKKKKKKKKK